MSEYRLKSCGRCGARVTITESHGKFIVRCPYCGLSTEGFSEEIDAGMEWNRTNIKGQFGGYPKWLYKDYL